jgi:hypothetical protein
MHRMCATNAASINLEMRSFTHMDNEKFQESARIWNCNHFVWIRHRLVTAESSWSLRRLCGWGVKPPFSPLPSLKERRGPMRTIRCPRLRVPPFNSYQVTDFHVSLCVRYTTGGHHKVVHFKPLKISNNNTEHARRWEAEATIAPLNIWSWYGGR